MSIEGYLCPKCGAEDMHRAGKTTNQGAVKQNYRCWACKSRTTKPRKPDAEVEMRTSVPKSKRYIVTAAQNATPLNDNVWNSLKQCAKHYDAELIVIPGRYKNPTSVWADESHDWWDAKVMPYLVKGTINLGNMLVILGNVKIQWWAMNPLTSLESLTKDKSGIVGHSRLALKSIATPNHKHPKIMYTTGAITQPNFTDSKQGKIAEFNHSYGGLIVEIAEDRFHVRQLVCMANGSFCDLDKEFTPDGVRDAPRPMTLVMGDTHWVKMDADVYKATFKSMLPALKPHYLIWHDLYDQFTRNHHTIDNFVSRFAKLGLDEDDVKVEVDTTLQGLVDHTPDDCLSVVVSSNHDRALQTWLLKSDFKKDIKNAKFYVDLTSKMFGHMKANNYESIDPFVLYGRDFVGDNPNIKFLNPDESFMLCGVEFSMHGDRGANGSRGSAQGLSKINVKSVIGHSHTASIVGGCWQVGTSTAQLEYSVGSPSSWSNTHCLQYYNGKRTLLTIINGRWKL
jgi:hypothetical protein